MFGLGLWMVTLSYYDGWYHPYLQLSANRKTGFLQPLAF
jgi:hypothetical protein